MATCIICLEIFTENEKPTTLTQKGCNGIIKASTDHGKKIFPVPGDKVKHFFNTEIFIESRSYCDLLFMPRIYFIIIC